MSAPAAVAHSVDYGPIDPNTAIHFTVSLPPRDAGGLKAFADSVSNPASPEFRKFITPEEVGQRFGLATSQVQSVVDYLKSYGIQVNLVAKNRMGISATGSAAQVQSAFNTTLHSFHDLKPDELDDPQFRSYVTAPSVPLNLQPLIADISGLETFTRPKHRGLKPAQTRTLYNVAPLYNAGKQGQGINIGISNWDGYRLSYLPTVYSQFGLPTPSGGVGSNVTVVTLNGGSGTGTQHFEGDLDVQCVLGVAPLCNLYIYDDGAGDLIGTLTREANDNIADIITESWGWSFGSVTTAEAAHTVHLTMTAQGITYMAASGDNGTTLSPYDYPDYDPEVLSVGGTTTVTDNNGNRTSEVGWSGSGGGWCYSTVAGAASFNLLPTWQKGTGVPTSVNKRLVPDLALNADPNTGYYIYYQGAWYAGGGTSASSPTFAAGLGVALQQLVANGTVVANGAGKKRLGRIQDLVYSLNGNSNVFFDVVSGANGNLPSGAASTAAAGWDYVTGWGAIKFNAFVNAYPPAYVVSSVVLDPTTVSGGTSSTGTVTISPAAPTGGTVVTLTSSNAAVSVPTTVTVASGATTATFTATTTSVASTTTSTITATLGSSSKTATLTVNPATVSSVSLNPTTVAGGVSSTGTVTIGSAAPAGGTVVTLSSNDSVATVPASVTVPQGSTSTTFTVSTSTVLADHSVTISATVGSSTQTATLSVVPVTSFSVSFPTSTVASGSTVTGTVTLDGTAPTGGFLVALGSMNKTALTVPASLTVPAGSTSATFTATALTASKLTSVQVNVAKSGFTTASTTISVIPPPLTGFTISQTTIVGGAHLVGTLTIGVAAPSAGVVVNLSSSNTNRATVPATVTIPSGATSTTFNIQTLPVASTGSVAISANTDSTAVLKAQFNTTASPVTMSTLTASPSTINAGATSTGTLTLTGPAPQDGYTVTLTSSLPTYFKVPATITVPEGSTSVDFTITAPALASSSSGYITASRTATASKLVTINTVGLKLTSVTASPTTIVGGSACTGTVNISVPAPAGGYVVNLVSSLPSYFGVPASVTIPEGSTSANFTITVPAVAYNASGYITASHSGSPSVLVVLKVTAPTLVSVTASPNPVVGGQTCTGTVTISSVAPAAGYVVNLTGTASSLIGVPASVTIPGGATSVTFAITTPVVAAKSSGYVTASHSGSSSVLVVITINKP